MCPSLFEFESRLNSLAPVLLLFVDIDELAKRLYVLTAVYQFTKQVLGAVQKSCAQ